MNNHSTALPIKPFWSRLKGAIFPYLISLLVTFTLASVAHTWQVLAALSELQVILPVSVWLESLVNDWLGLWSTYGIAQALGLLIAFSVSYWVPAARFRWILYGLAGATAMVVILSLLNALLDVTLIAGSRSFFGYTLQLSAGIIGGLVYHRLTCS
ncbi:MAG: hypothetical protein HWE11_09095 [Gammaproteobacteria bacterium]|nr:hypothetical protein [Gammaproteobacteria bacterium]